jgi:sugar lactone lactonase YvrE
MKTVAWGLNTIFSLSWVSLSLRGVCQAKFGSRKIKFLIIGLLTMASAASYADTEVYVETIVELSTRDALVVENDTLYASNYNNGRIYKIELDGTVTEVVGGNTRGPAGIRFDDSGNMYVAMYNLNSIVKIDSQGNESTFASGINGPIALDWDSAGDLYVSSFSGSNTVTRIASDGTQSQVAKVQQLAQVSSLCLDSSDDIYVTSYQSGDIYLVSQSGEVTLFAATGQSGLSFLQFDATNNVFYATVTNSGTLLQVNMDGTFEALINTPTGGSVDGPVATAKVDSAIGLAVSDDGKHVYFATDTHVRRLNIADPAVDQVRPYFTSDASAAVDGASSFSHQFMFEDPNNDPLTLTVENMPAWMTFDGVDTLSGTSSSADAAQTLVIDAKLDDGFAAVAQGFSLTINATSAAPTTPTPTSSPSGSGGGAVDIWWVMLLLLGCRSKLEKLKLS